MARRIYRTSGCVEYEKSTLSDKPKVDAKLFNARLEEYPSVLPLTIDTGFEGSILVTSDVYEFFKIGELPKKYWRVYGSLIGSITMRLAKAIIRIEPGVEIETYVETPLLGVGKLLIGRELLNNLIVVLDGPRKQACIAK